MCVDKVADGGHSLPQMLAAIRPGVVVRCTLNHMQLLAIMTNRCKQTAGVTRCAGVVGSITNHEHRHCDCPARTNRITPRVVITPL